MEQTPYLFRTRLPELNVRLSRDGVIFIEQERPGKFKPATICVFPEYVDLLIEWLMEAKEKIDSLE